MSVVLLRQVAVTRARPVVVVGLVVVPVVVVDLLVVPRLATADDETLVALGASAAVGRPLQRVNVARRPARPSDARVVGSARVGSHHTLRTRGPTPRAFLTHIRCADPTLSVECVSSKLVFLVRGDRDEVANQTEKVVGLLGTVLLSVLPVAVVVLARDGVVVEVVEMPGGLRVHALTKVVAHTVVAGALRRAERDGLDGFNVLRDRPCTRQLHQSRRVVERSGQSSRSAPRAGQRARAPNVTLRDVEGATLQRGVALARPRERERRAIQVGEHNVVLVRLEQTGCRSGRSHKQREGVLHCSADIGNEVQIL
eukprot:Rhum_TRINITY_DN16416_c0_g1::Rhum_TRINITY_DN16416_c0_g1_i1::g.163337::m.163337